MDQPTFTQALRAAYREHPCQVLPNALWKTLEALPSLEAHFQVRYGLTWCLDLRRPGEQHPYWHREGRPPPDWPQRMANLTFALVHQRYMDALPLAHFASRAAYFRLRHDLSDVATPELPPGYRFRQADMPRQAAEVARLIAACYPDLRPTAQAVRGWMGHPPYAPELWVWALSPAGDPAGLGIAELDRSVPEGSLEYIQVLPAHRRIGLGSALVNELLRRLEGRADFATVSGRVEAATHPERLYRRFGFVGQDVWWVLRAQD